MLSIDPELARRLDATQQRLHAELQPVVAEFPLATYLALVAAQRRVGRYHARSPALLAHDERLRSRFPDEAHCYRALVLTALMRTALARFDELRLTSDVARLCAENFFRILHDIERSNFSHMALTEDRFQKDLAAASMRLLCVGARKVNEVRLPPGIAKRAPLTWLRLVGAIGPRGTLYQLHLDSNDPAVMAEFNEDGWLRFHRRAAALMQRTGVQGLIGTSWFYDPALATVSPHLTYLRQLIVDNGGFSIRRGSSAEDVQNALFASATRRRLNEQGRYHPTSYSVVWLRSELFEWASIPMPAGGRAS